MLGAELEKATAEWLAVKEAEGLRPDTIRTYGDHIHIFLRWLAGRELIPLLFAAFFRDYAKTHAIASCASIYNSVRLLLKGIGRPDLAGTMRRPRGRQPPSASTAKGSYGRCSKCSGLTARPPAYETMPSSVSSATAGSGRRRYAISGWTICSTTRRLSLFVAARAAMPGVGFPWCRLRPRYWRRTSAGGGPSSSGAGPTRTIFC